jgi:hypothetical protein
MRRKADSRPVHSEEQACCFIILLLIIVAVFAYTALRRRVSR